jgi:hypothetical protein
MSDTWTLAVLSGTNPPRFSLRTLAVFQGGSPVGNASSAGHY